MADMRRREFITLLGGSAVWPLAASAQQIGRVWRIGVLIAERWPEVEGLHDGLRELGYRDGENVLLEYRFANGDAGRFPALVADCPSSKFLRQRAGQMEGGSGSFG
jgi:putative tryptophan/tyrosine transport system substrate-binding protein